MKNLLKLKIKTAQLQRKLYNKLSERMIKAHPSFKADFFKQQGVNPADFQFRGIINNTDALRYRKGGFLRGLSTGSMTGKYRRKPVGFNSNKPLWGTFTDSAESAIRYGDRGFATFDGRYIQRWKNGEPLVTLDGPYLHFSKDLPVTMKPTRNMPIIGSFSSANIENRKLYAISRRTHRAAKGGVFNRNSIRHDYPVVEIVRNARKDADDVIDLIMPTNDTALYSEFPGQALVFTRKGRKSYLAPNIQLARYKVRDYLKDIGWLN